MSAAAPAEAPAEAHAEAHAAAHAAAHESDSHESRRSAVLLLHAAATVAAAAPLHEPLQRVSLDLPARARFGSLAAVGADRHKSMSATTLGQLLLEACERKDSVEVMRSLLDGGADVRLSDAHDRTALFWCALLGNVEGTRTLLAAGASPAQADENGWLPEGIARALGHHDVVRVIKHAAEDRTVPKDSLFWAASAPDEQEGLDVLRRALAAGADVNEAHADGRTPLMFAALYGKERVLDALLATGAAPGMADAAGRTAAAWAAVSGRLGALRLLLRDAEGGDEAAAVLCARNGNARALRMLLRGGGRTERRGVDPAALLRGTRRTAVALVAALETEELCRAVVLNARSVHPLVTCLQGSASLERLHLAERSRDAASAEALRAAAVNLERLACGLVRTGPSRGALLHAKLCADGRTAVELAVDDKRKRFVALPVVQEHIDAIWYHSSIVYHMCRKSGVAKHVLYGAAFLAASPLLLLASFAHSKRALDLDVVYSPLERYVAKEALFLAFLILIQFLGRVKEDERAIPWGEGALGIWLLAIWAAELQHWLAARRAEKARTPLLRELLDTVTDGWKGMDVVAISLAVAAGATRVAAYAKHGQLVDVEQKMRAAANLMLWLRTTHVLAIFSFTGPLVRMVLTMIVHDLARWAFLQVLVLVSFASAFSALYSDVEPDPHTEGAEAAAIAFGSMGRAMKTLTEMSLNAGEPYPERTWILVANNGLGWVLMGLFSTATYLLLLNLLIAMLGHTVDAIRARSQQEFMFGRAAVALEARTLPVLPPPLNLLHLVCRAVGWALSPALRRLGALPAADAVAAEEAARAAHALRRTRSMVGEAAEVMRSGSRACWGILAGEPAAPHRTHWARPPAAELERLFDDAWADVLAELEPPPPLEPEANSEHAQRLGYTKLLHTQLLERHAAHSSGLAAQLAAVQADVAELKGALHRWGRHAGAPMSPPRPPRVAEEEEEQDDAAAAAPE